ncbi:MAG: hypothetical protein SQA66_04200 [Candidatus Fervidibacter sacchari]
MARLPPSQKGSEQRLATVETTVFWKTVFLHYRKISSLDNGTLHFAPYTQI